MIKISFKTSNLKGNMLLLRAVHRKSRYPDIMCALAKNALNVEIILIISQVTQVECTSKRAAPSGCTQYFTGSSGTIETYNYNTAAGRKFLCDFFV